MALLLYLKWITNKGLLYSPGNSAQRYVAASMGVTFGRECIPVYIWLSSFAVHLKLSQHFNRLYTNIKYKVQKEKKIDSWPSCRFYVWFSKCPPEGIAYSYSEYIIPLIHCSRTKAGNQLNFLPIRYLFCQISFNNPTFSNLLKYDLDILNTLTYWDLIYWFIQQIIIKHLLSAKISRNIIYHILLCLCDFQLNYQTMLKSLNYVISHFS